jgi:hypothetical protein
MIVKSEEVLLCLIRRLLYVRAATARTASTKIGKIIGAMDGPRLWVQLTPAGHFDTMAGNVDSEPISWQL